MLQHTNKDRYHCVFCDRKFTQKSALTRHLPSHDPDNPYYCKTCKQSFADLPSFTDHMDTNTLNDETSGARSCAVKCDLCSKMFSNPSNLRRHKKVHCPEHKYKCEVCQHSFAKESQLIRHMRRHDTISDGYPCTLCDKVFKHMITLNKHIFVHSGKDKFKNEFQCPLCEIGCSTKMALSRHLNGHYAVENKFPCTICQESFNSKNALQSHKQKRHGKGRLVKCNVCDQNVPKSSLAEHMTAHPEGVLLKCEVCDLTLASKQSLKRHMETHGQVENPLKCDVCDIFFATEDVLKIHTGSKHEKRRKRVRMDTENSSEKSGKRARKDISTTGTPKKAKHKSSNPKKKKMRKLKESVVNLNAASVESELRNQSAFVALNGVELEKEGSNEDLTLSTIISNFSNVFYKFSSDGECSNSAGSADDDYDGIDLCRYINDDNICDLSNSNGALNQSNDLTNEQQGKNNNGSPVDQYNCRVVGDSHDLNSQHSDDRNPIGEESCYTASNNNHQPCDDKSYNFCSDNPNNYSSGKVFYPNNELSDENRTSFNANDQMVCNEEDIDRPSINNDSIDLYNTLQCNVCCDFNCTVSNDRCSSHQDDHSTENLSILLTYMVKNVPATEQSTCSRTIEMETNVTNIHEKEQDENDSGKVYEELVNVYSNDSVYNMSNENEQVLVREVAHNLNTSLVNTHYEIVNAQVIVNDSELTNSQQQYQKSNYVITDLTNVDLTNVDRDTFNFYQKIPGTESHPYEDNNMYFNDDDESNNLVNGDTEFVSSSGEYFEIKSRVNNKVQASDITEESQCDESTKTYTNLVNVDHDAMNYIRAPRDGANDYAEEIGETSEEIGETPAEIDGTIEEIYEPPTEIDETLEDIDKIADTPEEINISEEDEKDNSKNKKRTFQQLFDDALASLQEESAKEEAGDNEVKDTAEYKESKEEILLKENLLQEAFSNMQRKVGNNDRNTKILQFSSIK